MTKPTFDSFTAGESTAWPTVEHLVGWLTQRVIDYGNVEGSRVAPTTPLAELGLDSVYALALCGDIEDEFGVDVDPTIVWDHPSIAQLAPALREMIAP